MKKSRSRDKEEDFKKDYTELFKSFELNPISLIKMPTKYLDTAPVKPPKPINNIDI